MAEHEIPHPVIHDIATNNAMIFLGNLPGRQRSGTLSAPSEEEIAGRLGAACDYAGPFQSLPEIAQVFQRARGRQALVQTVLDMIDQPQFGPGSIHQLLAELPFSVYLTTDLHMHLEQALRAAGRRFVKLSAQVDTSFVQPDCPVVVKLFGDVSDKKGLCLTARDRMRRLQDRRLLVDTIRGWLATRTVLLLAPDFQDDYLRRLLSPVFDARGKLSKRAYAVQPTASPSGSAFWTDGEIVFVEAEPSGFLESLTERVRSHRQEQKVEPFAEKRWPRRPFKFLDYYQEADTEIFFGRDAEIATVASQIQATRLFVLTGESGAGKTSLLLAGILPSLRSMGLMAVPIRFFDDPLNNVKQRLSELGRISPGRQTQVAVTTTDQQAPLRHTNKLVDLIGSLQADTRTPLILALDQFEEFFTRFPVQAQQRFISELSEALNDRDISVHFVLVIREDVFARLHLFRTQIPTIFDHTLHLSRLQAPQAEKAIVGPLEMFEVSFEADLVQAILSDLRYEGEIQPPQLQIVCDRIYQHLLDNGSRVATLALYERMGGAGQILAQYLEVVLQGLPESQRETSRAILKALVTSGQMKDLLTASEAAELAELDFLTTKESIDHLVNLRLLRPVRPDIEVDDGEIRYELAHDRLAAQISEWISEPEREARKAKEIVRRELLSWRDHRSVLHPEELEAVAKQRINVHLKLDAEESEMLLSSALQHDLEIDKWIERIKEHVDVVAVLSNTLESDEPQVRERATLWLGQFKDERAAGVLLNSALEDEVESVRKSAAESLVRVDGSAAKRLGGNLNRADMRVNAAKALWDHRRALDLSSSIWLRAGMITGTERLKSAIKASPTFTRRRLLPIGALGLLTAFVAIFVVVRLDQTPAQTEVNNENWSIVLRNRFNYAYATIYLDSDIQQSEVISDTGSGESMILVATGLEGQERGRIMAFDAKGNKLWDFDTFEDKYGKAYGKFVNTDLQLADLYNTEQQLIVFTAHHDNWFPSRLGILDLQGQLLANYSHPGFVKDFVIENFDDDDDLEILAQAENNNLRVVLTDDETGSNYQVVFLLDSGDLEGQAFPPVEGGGRSGHELWYTVAIPQGERIWELKAIDVDVDGIYDASFYLGDGILCYVNAEGILIAHGASDAWSGKHPGEDPDPQSHLRLIRKNENEEWELVPIPIPSRE